MNEQEQREQLAKGLYQDFVKWQQDQAPDRLSGNMFEYFANCILAREKGLREDYQHVRIFTRCPACKNDTLIINKGRLLCTWRDCGNPTLIDNLDTLTQQLQQTREALGHLYDAIVGPVKSSMVVDFKNSIQEAKQALSPPSLPAISRLNSRKGMI